MSSDLFTLASVTDTTEALAAIVLGTMRLAQFYQLVSDEFGESLGRHYVEAHVLSRFGETAAQLLEQEIDVRRIWWAMCEDFDIPEQRRLGVDY